ncbi:hypothetical protein ID875_28760 [Streptomyces globisporus]|uniref:Uncharacterized protein n=1 Tax=Streptomyces globisporus TaxID=1908 RepID=A0A927GPX8_STRGL|nr:hypothetical protein [Streptomyces globisporus]
MAGVGQIRVDPGLGGSRLGEDPLGAQPYGLVVRLVGGEGDEDPGAGGQRAQQGVEAGRFVALADVRAVGVVDEDLLGPEEGAGAGVLGAACLVRSRAEPKPQSASHPETGSPGPVRRRGR